MRLNILSGLIYYKKNKKCFRLC